MNLTPRQCELMEHVIQGLTAKESAALLHLSWRTVKTQRSHMIRRLGANNIAEAAAMFAAWKCAEQVVA